MFNVDDVDIKEITNYPLTLSVELSDNVVFKLSYNSNLFDNDAIAKLCLHLERTLSFIIENGHLLVKDIDIISEAERQRILYKFNDTSADYPRNNFV